MIQRSETSSKPSLDLGFQKLQYTLLNPVAKHEANWWHEHPQTVSEMTSCPEPQGFVDTPDQGPSGTFRSSPTPHSGPCPSRLHPPAHSPEQGPDHGSPPTSSPETLVDQILESVDSDSEGIFIDFGRGSRSSVSDFEAAGGRPSVV